LKKKLKPETNIVSIEIPTEWIGSELEISIQLLSKENKTEKTVNLFQQFFQSPIKIETFQPLLRKEIYENK
jgi:hypothetical protein